MALTIDEQKAVQELLVSLFGDDFRHCKPTEETVQELEFLFKKTRECSRKIDILLKSLPCGVYARGWVRRCAKSLNKLVKDNLQEFRLCTVFRRWQLERVIGATCR